MLQLKNITKIYQAGTTTVEALKGIDLKFRDNEFVSVLGPSGCGKTTMLNLLGGLDRYTSGDLIINGKSTKDFTDGDWDTYRNRRVGFVFQNYNLIPHQTVLSNVELALTLSGVSKTERRRRAVEVLEKVGLADQIHKKPTQMSGGQMQRVSIARALINNPDILLADEPTGALDSETSVQIMELIKEIARDRLVIMVTHNPDLAEEYSTRIIKLFDGKLVSDSNPYESEDERVVTDKKKKKEKTDKKTSMSFMTALALSANNLLTKKARTFLTAFAGSIGIIGIALIMALSSGSQAYIDKVMEDTLSTYPITIESTVADLTSIMTSMQNMSIPAEHEDPDAIYSHNIMSGMFNTMSTGREDNDLKAFMRHIQNNQEEIDSLATLKYSYNIHLNIYDSDYSDEIKQINPSNLLSGMGMGGSGGGILGGGMMTSSVNVWTEMLDNPALLESQYEVLAGRWPKEKNEVILIADENNEISDFSLYTLGLMDSSEINEMMKAIQTGEEFITDTAKFTYDELLSLKYKLVLSSDVYEKIGDDWVDMSGDSDYMKGILDNSLDINIVGIIRPSEEASMTAISGAIGYLHTLTEYIADQVNASEIVKAQRADLDVDVFTGKPFANGDEPAEVDVASLSEEVQAYLATLNPAEQRGLLENYATTSTATYSDNLALLGVVDLDTPSTISIYPKDFDGKEAIEEFIKDYNKENEEQSITYTDFIGMMMSSVSTIINMISYILIAFVGISLVVSSIMIGIITYVSVLERTKEIGILKSIGASNKDISRVFNAETLIVGFTAGSLGVAITLLLIIPANIIIKAVSGVSGLAVLPIVGAVVLVVLSMGLTFISGLIPSSIAAKKDPVVALRTE